MHFEKDERCIEREMKRTYALYFVLYTKKFKHLLADYCYPYSMYIKGSCFQKNYIYVSVKKKVVLRNSLKNIVSTRSDCFRVYSNEQGIIESYVLLNS